MLYLLIFTQIIHSHSGLAFAKCYPGGQSTTCIQNDDYHATRSPSPCRECLFYCDSLSQTDSTSILIMSAICHVARINSHLSKAWTVLSPNPHIHSWSSGATATFNKPHDTSRWCFIISKQHGKKKSDDAFREVRMTFMVIILLLCFIRENKVMNIVVESSNECVGEAIHFTSL